MRSGRGRGFSLIETMIVIGLIGVLALVATIAYRRWVRTTYLNEAQDMVANIRAAEESFKAENGGYLDVSTGLGPGYDYPLATPGQKKTAWGGACTTCGAGTWAALNIQPSGPVSFGYSLRATNDGTLTLPAITVNGAALDTSALRAPWYFIEADGDLDGNGVFTKVYASSATSQIFIDNEGE